MCRRCSSSSAENRVQMHARCTRSSIWDTVWKYTFPAEAAERIIAISESMGVPAKIIGRVEETNAKRLTLATPYGTFDY